jgi:hypothetical protein
MQTAGRPCSNWAKPCKSIRCNCRWRLLSFFLNSLFYHDFYRQSCNNNATRRKTCTKCSWPLCIVWKRKRMHAYNQRMKWFPTNISVKSIFF